MKDCFLLTLTDESRTERVRQLDEHPSDKYLRLKERMKRRYWRSWGLALLLVIGLSLLPMPHFIAILMGYATVLLLFGGFFYCLMQTLGTPSLWLSDFFLPTILAAVPGAQTVGTVADLPPEIMMPDGTFIGEFTGLGSFGSSKCADKQKVSDAVVACVPWHTGLKGTVVIRSELGEGAYRKVSDIITRRRVEMESVDLNEKYDVSSEDPTEARLVLRPDVMDKFNRLSEQGRHVTVLCTPDYVWFVDFGSHAFDIAKGREAADRTHVQQWELIQSGFAVIADLLQTIRPVLAEEE